MTDNLITWSEFEKIDIRSGTIISAKYNEKAKIPAYILTIDFGANIGIKKSSAQLTQNYTEDDLINKKVLAVINFPPKLIAGIKSEVLVLATVCDIHGTTLITPSEVAINGSKVK